ncbi:ABC transporter substrate-binding protein [Actinocorallia longicatena]|uniref:Extracellular solute-binding protein n=1 Tax=Actinocorallia longicatena TaxID=111803 RepID=A0ABP6PY47_9ACTN
MRVKFAVAGVLALSLLATACGSSGDDESPETTPKAQGKVELSFWSWAPNIEKIVAKWNASHPDVHVTFSQQANGDDLATKILTASKAGNAPDVFQAEYQVLPTYISNNAVADIAKEAGDLKSRFADGVWSQVTLGGDAVYAIPQDSGPMMYYYRADLFEKYGLKVPTTWDEFAQQAEILHKKDPKKYLTNFSAADAGWFTGLAQQAGASWWSPSGDTWKVAVNDEATRKVAGFWSGLVQKDLIDKQPSYTPKWNKALADGTLLSWPSAVWGPGVLAANAPKTAGKWKIAPLPQWAAGENKTGSWGGSATAVSAGSKNKAAAAAFAAWLNTDSEATTDLVKESAVYPAATSAQTGPALQSAPEFFSNQPDFYTVAGQIAGTAQGFTFGPNVNVTYSAYKDAFAKAIASGGAFDGALDQMQTSTVDDMKKNGFKVS